VRSGLDSDVYINVLVCLLTSEAKEQSTVVKKSMEVFHETVQKFVAVLGSLFLLLL